MSANRLTDGQKKDQILKQIEIKKRLAQKRRDYTAVFGTNVGKRVLRDLFEMSGSDKSDVVASVKTGGILLKDSLFNMAFRNYYRKIRQFVDPVVLREVEIPLSEDQEESTEVDILS